MARYAIIEDGIVTNLVEAAQDFAESQGWIESQGWGIGWLSDGAGGFVPPDTPEPPDPIPPEVPRYCGVLALKRHRLANDELQQLDEEEGWESGSLYAQLLAFRNALPSGALRDKLDVAIDHVMHWTLESPTVTEMCAVMGLSTAQRDALFRWAKAHEATL